MTKEIIFKFLRIIGARKDRREEERRSQRFSVLRTVRPLDPSVAAAYCDNTVINSRYTLYNFLLLSLYEQFRRPLNFYFLLVACLQFISVIAPVSPFSTLLPLLFAFSLTSLKEGYDDVKRHRQDHKYNNKPRVVLDPVTSSWQRRPNYRIRVGDVILLEEDEDIPCDVVVLASNAPTVSIRTDNLDGELDLKPRDIVFPHHMAPNKELKEEERNVGNTNEEEVEELINSDPNAIHIHDTCETLISKLSRVKFICPPPSSIVESFDGRAEFTRVGFVREDDSVTHVPMSHHHLLPQSCVLKRTKFALCVAVYTGEETKSSMNKRPPPVKWAKIDQGISRYSIFVFCCQLVAAVSFGLAGYLLNRRVENHFWYLQLPSSETSAPFIIYPLRFFLLTTVMIPVSFKCVVDISKYYMTLTVEWDEAMKANDGPPSSERMGCRVKNSDILEDLGQVDYVLTDKTGTLTQNVMELLYVTVGRERISLHREETTEEMGNNNNNNNNNNNAGGTAGGGSINGNETNVPSNEDILHFGRILSLCNSVETSYFDSQSNDNILSSPSSSSPSPLPKYQASSPDEEAICRGCARLHVQLLHRSAHEAILSVNGVKETWIVHHTFPFLSELKCMGVIVEEKSTGVIYYFVKGADDRIIEMSRSSPTTSSLTVSSSIPRSREPDVDVLMSHLNSYALQGLRTLFVAEKKLSRNDLRAFMEKLNAAEVSLHNRREQIKELRLQMETGVSICGITAIEDKLQEGVQNTLRSFVRAGIKVWMLTGDKVQTAVQIGLASSLYRAGNRLIYIMSGNTGNNNNDNDNTLGWEDHMTLTPLPSPPRVDVEEEEEVVVGEHDDMGNADKRGITGEETRYSYGPLMNDKLFKKENRNENNQYNTMASTRNNSTHTNSVLVVEGGKVLESILATPHLTERFAALSDNCVCVICARVTPSQKAALTHFVRSRGYITLAVGDGGNDVAMLQEAHVGVGIVGKEGQQASRAADFSIHRFSDLRSLVFVHGQQAYVRTAFIIKYSFYKSMLISFIQVAYNVAGTYFSGGTFWNSFSLTLWNGVYTLPQTFFYCLDRMAPRRVLEQNVFLYKLTRYSTDMNIQEFFLVFVLRGIIQSVVTLWIVTGIFDSTFAFPGTGWAATHDLTFSVAYSSLIISQMLTLLFESHSITFLNAFWIFGMPVVYVALTAAYSSISTLQYFAVWNNTLNATCFLAAFGVASLLVLPVFGLLALRQALQPTPRDVLRAIAVRKILRWQRQTRPRGRYLSQLSRWLFCVPEEASCLLPPPPPSTQMSDAC